MDFTGRGSQPAQPANAASQYGGGANAANNAKKTKGGSNRRRNLWRWGAGIFGLLIVALVVVVIFAFAVNKGENSYIKNNKLQAVFLQTGQVYFGNIDTLNNKYVVLSNIYYLQTSSNGSSASNTSADNTNVSLVKLGCELHAPYDKMVINRDQVTFWENLQDDGQVAKAVSTFEKDNPNGQKCSDQSSSASTNSNVQGTNTPSNASNGSTSSNTGSNQ